MSSRKGWIRVSTLALLVSALAMTGGAQDADTASQGQGPETFSGTVNVQVVNVDVHVTDSHGKAVTGLKRSDFELFEDGRPVKITNFYAETKETRRTVSRNVLPPASATTPASKAPAPAAESAQNIEPPRQRLWVVFFIDNLSLRPFDRNRVLRQLHQFVDSSIQPGDRAMVVDFDRSVKIVQPFTADRYAVLKAFDQAERLSAEGVHAEEDRDQILAALHNSRSAGDAIAQVDSYSGSLFNDVDTTIRALHDLVHSLSGLEGRKALVYVSNGLPMRAGLDVYNAMQQKYRQSNSLESLSKFNSTQSLEALAVEANSSRVVFYTLDAGGLRLHTDATASQMEPIDYASLDSDYISNRQSSLQLLARKTGGQSVINTNDVRAPMKKVLQDLQSYYSLGFSPSHEGDGRYHRITVKVKRRGLRLRYRQGYRDLSLATRMSDSTMAALHFHQTSNPLGAKLRVGKIEPTTEGDYLAPVKVEIPIDQLTAMPLNDGSRQLRVRLFVALRSDNGTTTQVHQVPIQLHVPADKWEALRHRSMSYVLKLTVSSGSQLLAVGVRDEIGAQASFVVTGIDAGA